MKIKLLGIFALGAFFGSAVNVAATSGPSGEALAAFSIEVTVDRAANGVNFTCAHGCAWETLSFACDPSGEDCVATISEVGAP